jgi:hypothetical protein
METYESLGGYTELTFNLGKLTTEAGLRDFRQDPTKAENSEFIVGLSSEQFREQAEASNQPLALGTFSQIEFNPTTKTFEARVVYDKDFFKARATKEGDNFEEILPIAQY